MLTQGREQLAESDLSDMVLTLIYFFHVSKNVKIYFEEKVLIFKWAKFKYYYLFAFLQLLHWFYSRSPIYL